MYAVMVFGNEKLEWEKEETRWDAQLRHTLKMQTANSNKMGIHSEF